MRILLVLAAMLSSLTAYSGEINVVGFKDGFGLEKANNNVTIYLDGEKVGYKKLPTTISTDARKTDITICHGETDFCESATIYPDNLRPVEVGFLMQSFVGNIYFKVLTGGGLKVIKTKVAEREAKSKEIEEGKTLEAKP